MRTPELADMVPLRRFWSQRREAGRAPRGPHFGGADRPGTLREALHATRCSSRIDPSPAAAATETPAAVPVCTAAFLEALAAAASAGGA